MNSHIERYPHLYASPSYRAASDDDIRAVVNGCGSARSKFDFVPDNLFGLSIEESCHRHDWGYDVGKTIEDKEREDRIWLNNMLREIERGTRWMRRPRRWLARRYYDAVRYYGGPAFWVGKE